MMHNSASVFVHLILLRLNTFQHNGIFVCPPHTSVFVIFQKQEKHLLNKLPKFWLEKF